MPNKNEIRTIPISLVNNVVSGGTVTINLETNDTYHKLMLETNIAYDKMTNVKLIVENNVAWEFENMNDLVDLLDKYNTLPTTAGLLQIPFVMNQLNQLNERILSAIGTADINNLVLEFKIDASVASPTIKATAEVSNNSDLGLMLHIKQTHADFATAGTKTITNNEIPRGYAVPVGGNDVYPRLIAIHFSNDDITDFELKTGNTSRYKASRVVLNHQLKTARPLMRTKLNNYTHIDFVRDGTIAGSFNMIHRNLAFIINISNSGSYDFYSIFLAPHRGV